MTEVKNDHSDPRFEALFCLCRCRGSRPFRDSLHAQVVQVADGWSLGWGQPLHTVDPIRTDW